MSTVYNPRATNIDRIAVQNIASSTNATPIKITTAANHGFGEGDEVLVMTHATNVPANGIWTIHVVSATEFTLLASVGTAVGGATGTVSSCNVSPQYTIPADGDDPTASSINVPLESIGDRSAWASKRVGIYRTDQALDQTFGTGSAVWANWSTSSGATGGWTENTAFTGTAPAVEVVAEDLVEVYFSTSSYMVSADGVMLTLWYQITDVGVAAAFGSATRVDGSGTILSNTGYGPVNMRAVVYAGAPAYGKKLSMFLAASSTAAGAHAYNLCGDRQIIVNKYRLNTPGFFG